jgi:hypothetical protein
VGPSTRVFDVGGQLVTPPIRGRAGELNVIGALLGALALLALVQGLLNRAGRYREAEDWAVAALPEAASPQEEAEIRLRCPMLTKHSAQRRVEELCAPARTMDARHDG